jgi:MYXO-CTERM domain-containing protein
MRSPALLVVTAVATWLWCDRADACEIGIPIPSVEFPAEDETGLPTNPVLWLERDDETPGDTFALRTPDDSHIPLVMTRVFRGGSLFLVLRPREELLPNTSYDITRCSMDSCGSAIRTFITGDGPDLDPPAPPEELGRESGVDRMVLCGGNAHWVEVDVAFDGLLVVDLDDPGFDEHTLSGRLDWLATDDGEPLEFGEFGLGSGSPVHARVGALDRAGNFSGWVELDPIEVGGCGCTSDPDAMSAARWTWLGVLLGAITPRRRRVDA